MKYSVILVNILFSIHTVYSTARIQANYQDEDTKSVSFIQKSSFRLSCNVSEAGASVIWEKDGKPITEIASLKGRSSTSSDNNVHTLKVTHAVPDDAGNYSCLIMGSSPEERSRIRVLSGVAVKVPSNINAVEGEKLQIICQVAGNPIPELSWSFKNDSFDDILADNALPDDIDLQDEKDVPNAKLVISVVEMRHRGEYTCIGRSTVTDTEVRATCMVRVKDKYAALWPFLGICAEVIVLCAIIFIYEKKRNKTELEESDTDQSPDQKNTPDHGKDSNLRHRQ